MFSNYLNAARFLMKDSKNEQSNKESKSEVAEENI